MRKLFAAILMALAVFGAESQAQREAPGGVRNNPGSSAGGNHKPSTERRARNTGNQAANTASNPAIDNSAILRRIEEMTLENQFLLSQIAEIEIGINGGPADIRYELLVEAQRRSRTACRAIDRSLVDQIATSLGITIASSVISTVGSGVATAGHLIQMNNKPLGGAQLQTVIDGGAVPKGSTVVYQQCIGNNPDDNAAGQNLEAGQRLPLPTPVDARGQSRWVVIAAGVINCHPGAEAENEGGLGENPNNDPPSAPAPAPTPSQPDGNKAARGMTLGGNIASAVGGAVGTGFSLNTSSKIKSLIDQVGACHCSFEPDPTACGTPPILTPRPPGPEPLPPIQPRI